MKRRIIQKKVQPSKGKVRNATKVEYDGIKFKSKLELYCYKKLKENKIKATYEGETFTIIDAFEYKGEKVRKATYKPDFVGKEFIIECKGHANDAWPIRCKLFKRYLYNNNSNIDYYIVKNKKQIDEVVETIYKRSKK